MKDHGPIDYAGRIQHLRRQLGLSQAALAELLGVSEICVQRWERGRSRPMATAWQNVLRHEQALSREGQASAPDANGTDTALDQHPASPFGKVVRAQAEVRLPRPLTRFVGRVWEREELLHLLAQTRLMRLVGPPGCGKTRLAVEVARPLAAQYPAGIVFIDLTVLNEAARVPYAVAAALRLREESGVSLTETLIAGLQDGPRLLVLDNCEHVVAARAALVAALLQGCPELRILATSREPLGVEGEAVQRLGPLAVPTEATGENGDSWAAIGATESERLLLDRIVLTGARVEWSEANIAPIARICRRLDGLPLALELAAAWTPILTVQAIAARLDDRFALLVDRGRTGPAHHPSLRAAIAWSYELLGADERRLFERLAVCAGSFTLEAAEALAALPSPDESSEPPSAVVLTTLANLVSKSLVVMEARQGSARYRMLESLRAFGRERLAESGETGVVLAAHASYYAELAERWLQQVTNDTSVLFACFDEEQDNLNAALAWSTALPGDGRLALRLCLACWRWWDLRGRYREGRGWLQRALARASGDSRMLAQAYHAAGVMAHRAGDLAAAGEHLDTSLSLWLELGDRRGEAMALNVRGIVASEQDEHERARTLIHASLAAAATFDDPAFDAAALGNLGIIELNADNNAVARAILEQSLAMTRALGLKQAEANNLANMGTAAEQLGERDAAREFFQACLTLSESLGYATAIAVALNCLGHLARREGDPSAALDWHQRALTQARALRVAQGISDALRGLALVAVEREQWQRSTRLFGAAEAQGRVHGTLRDRRYDAELAAAERRLESALGPQGVRAAWEAGRRLPLQDAVALGLEPDAEPRAPAVSAKPAAPPTAHIAPRAHLTQREHQVLRLLAAGRSNKEIGRDLALSARTVERHITNLYAKIGARGKAEAIAFALRADSAR